MKPAQIFHQYIWIINTLRAYRKLTLEELNQKWKDDGVADGAHLFWASSSWAVAYGVARDCGGYEGSVKDFERKALNLSLPLSFKYECSVGTVQRTISNHPYMRLHIDKWREGGASLREIVLMEFLKKFLQ